jgi:hypothetical protein
MVDAADRSSLLSRLESHSVNAAKCSSLLLWLMLSLLESHSVDASKSAMQRNESQLLITIFVQIAASVLIDVSSGTESFAAFMVGFVICWRMVFRWLYP